MITADQRITLSLPAWQWYMFLGWCAAHAPDGTPVLSELSEQLREAKQR